MTTTPVRIELRAGGSSAAVVRDALTAAGYRVTEVTSTTRRMRGDVEPDLVIIDDRRPGWIHQISRVRESSPGIRIMVLCDRQDEEALLSAIAAGASGFCSLSASADAVVRSVRSVLESGADVPRSMVAALVNQIRRGKHVVRTISGPVELTDREWEILNLIVQRRSTREMSAALFVSEGTVRSHVSTLMRKIGVSRRADLVERIEGFGP